MAGTEKKTGVARIVAVIAAGILPFLLLLFGVLLLLGDSVITGSFAITYVLLPCAVFAGCVLVIRSRQHPGRKAVLCVVLLVVMVCLFVYLMAVGHYSIFTSVAGDEAAALYRTDVEHISVMPDISELGQPETIEYRYFFNVICTYFDSDCYMLFCRYSDDDYQIQKDQLGERYAFQEEAPTAFGYSVEPTITIDGYDFRFLSFDEEEYRLYYPKNMMLIATNDETREVVYLYYSDDDLDYIESMEAHFLDDFGWKYIR